MAGVAQAPAIRSSALTAALVWIGLHLLLAVLFADGADHLSLYLLGLAIFLLGSAVALWPLTSAGAGRAEAWWAVPALAVTAVLSSLFDLLALEPGAATGYSNWAAGATGVLIAALVLRDHGSLALGAGAAIVVIQTAVYVADPGPASVARIGLLAVPPELWLLGSWTIRGLIRRADRTADRLRDRAALDAGRRAADERQAEIRAELVEDLDERVVPLLRSVAAGDGPVTSAEVESAARASASLRDDLRARSLLEGDVRRAVDGARERGCRVLLSSELPSGPASAELARLLVAVLDAAPSAVVVRARRDPDEATVVVTGGPGTAAFESAAGLRAPGWSVRRALDVDGELVATLTRR